MSLLDPLLDLFRGRTITVPPLDGAFRPNTCLDDAPLLAATDAPDAIVSGADGGVYVSSGRAVLSLDVATGRTACVATLDSAITALAALPAGGLMVGLDDGRLVRLGEGGRAEVIAAEGLACPVAMAARDDGTVLVAQGSATRRPSEWARDLMERNATGTLWSVEPERGSARPLARDLAYPYGLAIETGSHVVVAESWRHRLVRIPLAGGRTDPVLTALPGYPARLSPAVGGGWWLALFAPRNRLIEFVLDEPDYRRAMLATVPPEHWIAPALSPPRSFLDPLQCGAVRTMGVSKAWAPSRSFGVAVRLDARFRPRASLHSRANGRRHGVTAVLDLGDRVLVAAKGADAVLSVSGGGTVDDGEASAP